MWPFLCRSVRAFQSTLRPRERASFDPEDVLLELWSKVAERDHLWEAERGRYVSFVGAIVTNELHRIRDRTKTVRSPGNSSARLREYQAREASGTLTPGQHKTASDIRRVIAGQIDLTTGSEEGQNNLADIADRSPTIDEQAAARDAHAAARDAIIRGLSALTVYESKLLGEAFGLWGWPPQAHSAIARKRRRSVGAIRMQIHQALIKCRRAIDPDFGPVEAGETLAA